MFDSLTVLAFICLYMAFLLLTAEWTERVSHSRRSLVNNALVYSLALGVYCSTWTYYGSVGTAAASGFLFLSIYLGPTLIIALWWTVQRKLVRIKTAHRITSIADLLSARYGRSQAVGSLVAFIAVVGITPYVALQFRAISSSFAIISGPAEQAGVLIGKYRMPMVLVILVLFTIVLGIRRLDPTERHPGMMMALAAESVVKLFAFLAAGIFVTYFMYDGVSDIFARLPINPAYVVPKYGAAESVSPLKWTTYLILSMSAIMFLPRQFHVGVVENLDERHIRTAMWLLPLYLFLITLFTFPIAMVGLLSGYPIRQADTFVLALPLNAGHPWLSLFVFLGGLSAATGMIMVSSITISTMVVNHFLLPIVGWIKGLGFLRRYLLECRWLVVTLFLMVGYWSEKYVGATHMLTNIGIISFAAVFQFAPAIVGGLFWSRANKLGALMGLGSGFVVWGYTLLLPAFVKSGWFGGTLLAAGPWGIGFLNPERLFGIMKLDPVTHSVFWSLFFNMGLFVLGSLYSEQSPREQDRADQFVGIPGDRRGLGSSRRVDAYIPLTRKRRAIEGIVKRYFKPSKAARIADRCIVEAGIQGKRRISVLELARLQSEVEKTLAGSLGAAEAHRALVDRAVFTPAEARELSDTYGEILADLRVDPEDLNRKIDYYRERETLLERYASELEEKVGERTRDLEAAQRELIRRERLSVLGRLTAFVSHELRNPLAVIASSAFYIRRKFTKADEKVIKHFNRIDQQIGLCSSIISEMLEFTRGRPSYTNRGDLNLWLTEVLDRIETPEDIRIVRNLAPMLPPVYFDKEKLRSVVSNLIQNSVDAVLGRKNELEESGGEFAPEVMVATSAAGSKGVRIEVRDNGIGMSRETSALAFEPLFTTKARGTGLGLPIVKKIVEEHHARVLLQSDRDSGTIISFVLSSEMSERGAAGTANTETR